MTRKDSTYMICVSTMPRFKEIKEYREFADRITDIFGYKPIRYGARFLKRQTFGDSNIRTYRKTDNTYFDAIPFNEFSGFRFAGNNVIKSNVANYYLDFDFYHESNEIYTIIVLEKDFTTTDAMIEEVEIFKKSMKGIVEIKTLVADFIASEKDAYTFVSGIGSSKRSEYENEVAYSISQFKHQHKTMPYLFAYSYIKKKMRGIEIPPEHVEMNESDGYTTITLPRCFGKELEEYPRFSEWQNIYSQLKARGELIVTKNLETMINRIVKTGYWEGKAMIYDANNLDIIGAKKDGSVNLYIISSGGPGGLDDSEETQTLLLDKVQNYLGYIASEEFVNEFGKLTPEQIHIILTVDEPLSPLYEELLEKVAQWVKENGARFYVEKNDVAEYTSK